ncbi:plastocyanin/azurin family copper-binding protein [Solirubrobacter ginsenosidimutans]|uniref:Plastocyanin/azurin family copper-binding protein n=1 Tax=Solirubrobacter ginsenosidimutans TaxID=490573 RepID=A0A9X3MRE5_9ACTN|nr:plastocyanin/azurin family copper-binding protein [Solirubrobacter ginsenosidimutans]MDA0159843.1 plastocyanin/azurin family copper-binding protein [Solirubrobacter ginsenosidimutans]
MRRGRSIATACFATMAAASPAHAAVTRPIQAVDDPVTLQKYWTPAAIGAQQGDTVEWRLTEPGNAHAAAHNLWLVPPGGTEADAVELGASDSTPTVDKALDQVGTYQFFCSIHGGLAPGGMNGTITVGTEDPGPPVDPGTPWTAPEADRPAPPAALGPPPAFNTSLPPTVFEVGNSPPPRLSRLRLTAMRHGVRVRVKASQAGTLTIRVLRGARTFKTRTVKLGVGVHGFTVTDPRHLKAGRYQVRVVATDAAQLASEPIVRTVRITR